MGIQKYTYKRKRLFSHEREEMDASLKIIKKNGMLLFLFVLFVVVGVYLKKITNTIKIIENLDPAKKNNACVHNSKKENNDTGQKNGEALFWDYGDTGQF